MIRYAGLGLYRRQIGSPRNFQIRHKGDHLMDALVSVVIEVDPLCGLGIFALMPREETGVRAEIWRSLGDRRIQALIDKLPKPNTIWSIDDRGSWLKAAAMAFNIVYRTETPSVLTSVG